MLEFFRRHVGGGLVGVLLVGVLAVAFAFSFGAQSKGWGAGQSEQMAAIAGDYDITEVTLDYAYYLIGGRGLDPNDSQASALRLSALEGLIERSLLLEVAKDLGITATQEEALKRFMDDDKVYLTRPIGPLAERMEAYPFFNPKDAATLLVSEGHRIPLSFRNDEEMFDIELYKNYIRNQLRQTNESFVEQQRLEIIAERIRQLIVSAVQISDEEIRNEYNRENDTASIKYIRFIPTLFADLLKPTPDELNEWAKEHADEIKQDFEKNQFRYTDLEEQVRARHILIKVDENADEATKQAAREKIEDLLKRAKAGESFETLATENSEDPGSAKKGGDLGYTPRGRMVPEFDKVMFETKPGQMSDVVETKYGFHIIKVEGVRKGNVSLEEATPEIAEKLYKEANGSASAKTKAEELLARLKAGESLDALIPKESEGSTPSGLQVMTSRPFDKTARSIPGIGEAPEMVEAAFSGKDPQKLFELRGDFYLMAIDERNEPNDEQFKEKREELRAKLLSLKQAAWLQQQIKALREKAEKAGRIKIVYAANTATPAPEEAPAQKEDNPSSAPEGDKQPASKKTPPSAPAEKDQEQPSPASEEPDDE